MTKQSVAIGSFVKCQFGNLKDTTGSIIDVPVQVVDVSNDGKAVLVKKEGLEHYGRAIRREHLNKAIAAKVTNDFYCTVSVYGKPRIDAAAILGF